MAKIACKIATNSFDPSPRSRSSPRHHHAGSGHPGLPSRPRRRRLLSGSHQTKPQSRSLPLRRRFLPPPIPGHHLRQTNCRINPPHSSSSRSNYLALAIRGHVSDSRRLPANCPSLLRRVPRAMGRSTNRCGASDNPNLRQRHQPHRSISASESTGHRGHSRRDRRDPGSSPSPRRGPAVRSRNRARDYGCVRRLFLHLLMVEMEPHD